MIVIPTDAAAGFLGDKHISRRRPAERQNDRTPLSMGRRDKVATDKIPDPGQRLAPHAARKRRHHRHAECSELRLGGLRFLIDPYSLGALRPPPTGSTRVWPGFFVSRAHNHKPAKSVLRMLTHLAESPTQVKFPLQAEH